MSIAPKFGLSKYPPSATTSQTPCAKASSDNIPPHQPFSATQAPHRANLTTIPRQPHEPIAKPSDYSYRWPSPWKTFYSNHARSLRLTKQTFVYCLGITIPVWVHAINTTVFNLGQFDMLVLSINHHELSMSITHSCCLLLMTSFETSPGGHDLQYLASSSSCTKYDESHSTLRGRRSPALTRHS
jgi:hypothetical protein